MHYTFTFLFLFFFSSFLAVAQKKPLNHEVYDGWQSVSNSSFSKNGKWIAYAITPQEGDNQFLLYSLEEDRKIAFERLKNPIFSNDSEFFIAQISPLFQETRTAKINKKKNEEMPSDSLLIYALKTGKTIKLPRVKEFKIPKDATGYLAYLQTKTPNSASKDSINKKEKYTNFLFIKSLQTGGLDSIKYVEEYAFDEQGNKLFYRQSSPDSLVTQSGVYLYDLKQRTHKPLSTGEGDYKNIAFDKSGTQLAFTAYKGPLKNTKRKYSLYYFSEEADSAITLGTSAHLPDQWEVSPYGKVSFSEDGEKLYFGTAPQAAEKDTTLVDFETAVLDIWHWQDDYLQPQQLVNLKRSLETNYLTLVLPKKNPSRFIQLANPDIPTVSMDEDKNSAFFLGLTDVGRRIETQWKLGAHQDLWLVSSLNGDKSKIASSIRGPVSFSPEGKFVIWFDRERGHWFSYSVATGKIINLTQPLEVSFGVEDNDVPDEPNSYGIAGWSAGDAEVFINDKFDVWSFNPETGAATCLTKEKGRTNQFTYRLLPLGGSNARPEKSWKIDPSKTLYLSTFNHLDKTNGITTYSPDTYPSIQTLLLAPFTFRNIQATKDLSAFIYTKENYRQSPDLYFSKDFINEKQITHINPQQKNYNWGNAELVQWKTPEGHEAEGILYKPEDFDPNRQYPMIAYFYEVLSDGLYQYIPPTPTPSRLNISYFVSNGYLVFAPDIRYQNGFPGKAAEEYVNSGVEYLKNRPYVNPKAIGIQGQSWGGYQVAHLITRTDMYAAAWSGAPVVNMTSAYGGIRWQTGMSRQFQYERTQSRIGHSLWDRLDLYLENSPLFHLPKVNTPVVIMANDADGAVPWYQGIEFFTALRRLGKPVWLLNYNGDAHNLVKRSNRKDIQIREQQFFDHYLKGEPAPVWLEKGVPATLKGIDWGLGYPEQTHN